MRVGRTVGRAAALRALWEVGRGIRRPGVPGLQERLRALPRMTGQAMTGRYPGLARGRLGLFALAVLYLVSPVDAVPELLLPVLGLGDDAVLLTWLAGSVLAEAAAFLAWEQGADREQGPRRGDGPDDPRRVVTGEVVQP